MFRVQRAGRGHLVEDRIRVLRRLWAGDSVEIDGRAVRITPGPFTPGGPMLAYGGGTAVAARRAARLGLLFLAESHDLALEDVYRDEGGPDAPGCIIRGPRPPTRSSWPRTPSVPGPRSVSTCCSTP